MKKENFIKKIYHSTKFYKRIKRKRKRKETEQEKLKTSLLMEKIRYLLNDGLKILDGPFARMKYIEGSFGSAFFPKIIGTYEAQINNWVNEIITSDYDEIYDIGCAEGYYAVGFAMKCPKATIYAFDSDSNARTMCKNLVNINDVPNVIISGEIKPEELNEKLGSKKKMLVFCDIEGGEYELLNPEKVNNLKYVDILVESHDFIIPGMTETLKKRFQNTHRVETVIDDGFRSNTKYNFVNNLFNELSDEKRPENMKFLMIRKKNYE